MAPTRVGASPETNAAKLRLAHIARRTASTEADRTAARAEYETCVVRDFINHRLGACQPINDEQAARIIAAVAAHVEVAK